MKKGSFTVQPFPILAEEVSRSSVGGAAAWSSWYKGWHTFSSLERAARGARAGRTSRSSHFHIPAASSHPEAAHGPAATQLHSHVQGEFQASSIPAEGHPTSRRYAWEKALVARNQGQLHGV
ncbi:hypothetical protein VIGAN_02253900 [Vigna angularis var. angularis]|uniref:Uncharacterized protein n=1 Tax=Vigna angularis var. angularis TaxID=157739 RepID=A0A0S3RG18_PHAAN|nr:hypothetical protein VIGAN_02253900 [Vigna angularis var. angularis]